MSSTAMDLPPVVNEKRQDERRHSKFNKLLPAAVSFDRDQQDVSVLDHVFLVDMSAGGMRITIPQDWTVGEELFLRIRLRTLGAEFPEFLSTRCSIRWKKKSAGGIFVYGLQFLDLTPEQNDTVEALLNTFEDRGGRQHFRLECFLPIDVELSPGQFTLMNLRDLSLGGFRIRHKLQLPNQDSFGVVLDLKNFRLTVQAKLRWQNSFDQGVNEYGCSFEGLTDKQAQGLIDYMVDFAG